MVFPTLRKGSLAYYDGLRSLVPVRVIWIKERPPEPYEFNLILGCQAASTKYEVKVEVTKDVPGYRKGEVFDTTSLHVFPRECWEKHSHGFRLLPFSIEAEAYE